MTQFSINLALLAFLYILISAARTAIDRNNISLQIHKSYQFQTEPEEQFCNK